jgi:hypothetical protein
MAIVQCLKPHFFKMTINYSVFSQYALRILLIRVPVVVSICFFQNYQDKILRILRCDMEIYFQNRFLIFYSTFVL